MLQMNLMIDDMEDRIEASINLDSASIADLTICERMLRRYLLQVSNAADLLLDKDTKAVNKNVKSFQNENYDS